MQPSTSQSPVLATEQTLCRWKQLYSRLGTGELRRLKQLADRIRTAS